MNKIEINTKIGLSELFEFTMTNNYKSIKGVISVLFSIASLIGLILFWKELNGWQRGGLLFFAIMFTVLEPIEYYLRSKRQMKKNFALPISYTFDERGIEIILGDEKALNEWSDVMKVVSSKNLVAVYLSPVRAFILPKKDIGENYASLKEMLDKQTSCYKFKM